MHASLKVLAAGTFATLAAFASMSAFAQSDGSDYHPMQTNNTAPSTEVNAGAMAAARPTGTESIGQSTGAPMVSSQLTREEVRRGAIEAAHPLQTESLGQSTGMAGITSGTPR
jgi:hypothetical protein